MNHTQNILKIAEHLTTMKEVQSQMMKWAQNGISIEQVQRNIENLALGIYVENNPSFKEEIYQAM